MIDAAPNTQFIRLQLDGTLQKGIYGNWNVSVLRNATVLIRLHDS